jgi:hypothetical protein
VAISVAEPPVTTASASVSCRRARETAPLVAPTDMTADDDTRRARGATADFAFAAHKFIVAAQLRTAGPLMNKD